MRHTLIILLLVSGCVFGETQALGSSDGSSDGSSGSSGSAQGSGGAGVGAQDSHADDGSGTTEDGMWSSSSGYGSTDNTSDGRSGDGDTSDGSGEGSTGDTSDGGPGDDSTDDHYPPCRDDSCEQSCVLGDRIGSACAPDCDKGGGCPGLGVCLPDLVPGPSSSVCVLPCSGGCPGGMTCNQMTYGGAVVDLCMW